jgi:pimeloyl-ACP methyl ester carboxylesterase
VAAFVLVHSPLGAPYTWEPVARELTEMGSRCAVPTLPLEPGDDGRYWPRHVAEITKAAVNFEGAVVLVAHSGAGPLLAEAAVRLKNGAEGVVFVDASLPHPGISRLKSFKDDDEVAAFRARAQEGMIAPFARSVLNAEIESDEAREAYIATERPMPIGIYEEALPTSELPPIPVCYLQFSAGYDHVAAEARARGWRYRHLPGTHFLLLDRPAEVARILVDWFR